MFFTTTFPAINNMILYPQNVDTWTDVIYTFFAYALIVWIFAKITQHHLAWPYYLLSGVGGWFVSAVVNEYLYFAVMIALLYYVAFHRTASFNRVASGFLLSYALFSATRSLIINGFDLVINQPFHLLQRLGTNPYTIVEAVVYTVGLLILVPLLVKGLAPRLRNYLRVVVPTAPVIVWVINLLILVLIILSFAAGYRVVTLNSWQLLLVLVVWYGALYALGYFATKHYSLKSETASQRVELHNLRLYTSHIETLYDDLRRFRHDYKNILYSLTGALDDGNTQQAQEILHRVIQPSAKEVNIRTSVLGRLANIQDLGVKSLVYSKIIAAINQHLDFQVEIEQPFAFAETVDQLDVVRILSILLDNAIHAASQSTGKKVNLSLFAKDGLQYLVVGNSTKEAELNLQQLDRNVRRINFSSNHGLGLKNLRMILARYPGVSREESSQNHWFEQVIRIPAGQQD